MKFLMQRSKGKKIVHNAIFGMRFSCKSSPSIRNFAHFLFLLKPVSCFKITQFEAVNIMIES